MPHDIRRRRAPIDPANNCVGEVNCITVMITGDGDSLRMIGPPILVVVVVMCRLTMMVVMPSARRLIPMRVEMGPHGVITRLSDPRARMRVRKAQILADEQQKHQQK